MNSVEVCIVVSYLSWQHVYRSIDTEIDKSLISATTMMRVPNTAVIDILPFIHLEAYTLHSSSYNTLAIVLCPGRDCEHDRSQHAIVRARHNILCHWRHHSHDHNANSSQSDMDPTCRDYGPSNRHHSFCHSSQTRFNDTWRIRSRRDIQA